MALVQENIKAYTVLDEKHEGTREFQILNVDGKIILKYILQN